MFVHNNAVISFTNKCTASCKSCCMDCSPNKNDCLKTDVILSAIDDLHKMGISVLLLSGGEPFIYYDEVLTILRRAKQYNMLCSINTNAYWCHSVDITKKKLVELRRCGLTNIITSVDIFHNEFINIDKVKNLLIAAQKIGVRPLLNLCGGYDEANHGLIDLMAQLGESAYNVDIRIFPLLKIGAAKRNFKDIRLDYTYVAEDLQCVSYQTLHILPNGDVCVCCCDIDQKSPFVIGNINNGSLEKIVANAMQNSPYCLILTRGFSWIKKQMKNLMPELSNMRFSNPCEFCEMIFCQQNSEKYIQFLNSKKTI